MAGHPNDAVDTGPANEEAQNRNRYPDCPYEKVDECDLLAQQSMAGSTDYMNKAAWVGVLLSTIAVGLIWKTMNYTAAAARHSKDAAGAAWEAVDQTRRSADLAEQNLGLAKQTAMTELRAYISMTPAGLRHSGESLYVLVEFKNSGNTPAYKVGAGGRAEIREYPLPPIFRPKPIERAPGYSVIHPGVSYPVAYRVRGTFTKDEVLRIRKSQNTENEVRIYLFGAVGYVDIFGEARMTEVAWSHTMSTNDVTEISKDTRITAFWFTDDWNNAT